MIKKAEITFTENEMKQLLAEILGVEPGDIRTHLMAALGGGTEIEFIIEKTIEFSPKQNHTTTLRPRGKVKTTINGDDVELI